MSIPKFIWLTWPDGGWLDIASADLTSGKKDRVIDPDADFVHSRFHNSIICWRISFRVLDLDGRKFSEKPPPPTSGQLHPLEKCILGNEFVPLPISRTVLTSTTARDSRIEICKLNSLRSGQVNENVEGADDTSSTCVYLESVVLAFSGPGGPRFE